MNFDYSDIERFHDNIDPWADSGCWIWTGSVSWKKSPEVRHQYGIFNANGKKYKAHRVSYTLHNGEIPEGHVVRHKCDNPRCVNPAHLETGTQYENDMDRTRRGRSRNQHTGRINR